MPRAASPEAFALDVNFANENAPRRTTTAAARLEEILIDPKSRCKLWRKVTLASEPRVASVRSRQRRTLCEERAKDRTVFGESRSATKPGCRARRTARRPGCATSLHRAKVVPMLGQSHGGDRLRRGDGRLVCVQWLRPTLKPARYLRTTTQSLSRPKNR